MSGTIALIALVVAALLGLHLWTDGIRTGTVGNEAFAMGGAIVVAFVAGVIWWLS